MYSKALEYIGRKSREGIYAALLLDLFFFFEPGTYAIASRFPTMPIAYAKTKPLREKLKSGFQRFINYCKYIFKYPNVQEDIQDETDTPQLDVRFTEVGNLSTLASERRRIGLLTAQSV